MKLYGYIENADSDSPSVLEEVTVAATPNSVRSMASFFRHVGHNGGTPHVHLEFLRPNHAGTKLITTKNVHIPLVD